MSLSGAGADNKNVQPDAFDNSLKIRRTPPATRSITSGTDHASSAIDKIHTQKWTKSTKIVCNGCQLFDKHTKILCLKCKKWWHINCLSVRYEKLEITEGKCFCDECRPKNDTRKFQLDESNIIPVLGDQNAAQNFVVSETTVIEIEPSCAIESTRIDLGPVSNAGDQVKGVEKLAEPNASLNPGTRPKDLHKSKHEHKETSKLKEKSGSESGAHHERRDERKSLAGNAKAPTIRSRSSLSTLKTTAELLEAEIEIERKELEIEQKGLALEKKKLELKKLRIRQQRHVSEFDDASLGSVSYHPKAKIQETVPTHQQVRGYDIRSKTRPGIDQINSAVKNLPGNDDVEDERRNSVIKCNRWVRENVREFTSSQHQRIDSLSFLKRDVTANEFLNATLGEGYKHPEMDVSKSHLRARQVMSKDLPIFCGDPKEWPQFISRFTTTTKHCGFSADENIERLSRCLKGEALEAVKSDLLNPNLLPNALYTLKSLYGRPEVVFNSLVKEVKSVQSVKLEKFDTLIVFAMRVKALCETSRAANTQGNLNNSSLLSEFVEKLPPILQLEWGKHQREQERAGILVNIETFDVWLQDRADDATAVAGSTISSVSSPKSKKPANKEMFQGGHQRKDVNKCELCNNTNHVIKNCFKFKEYSVSKRWAVIKQKHLCVRCLGHHFIRDCDKEEHCTVEGCNQKHHPLLHSNKEDRKNSGLRECPHECSECLNSSDTRGNNPLDDAKHIHLHSAVKRVMFQILPVVLSSGDNKYVQTYAFLDSGSEITLVDESLVKKIGVSGKRKTLKLKWTGEVSREEVNSQEVDLYISDAQSINLYPLTKARTVKNLNLPLQNMLQKDVKNLDHLKVIPFESFENIRPKILIGLDNFQLMVPQETIEGEFDDPVAIRTRLGWTVFGSTELVSETEAFVNQHVMENEKLANIMDEFFSFENLGIKVPKQEVESQKDKRARQIMNDTLRRSESGRYEIGLLWTQNKPNLPPSKNMAIKRFLNLEKKMNKNHELRMEVVKQMRDYISSGYLERVPESDIRDCKNPLWYLPIFPVTNPNKPGKTRIVWDAAAKVQEQCLNTFLLAGPDTLTNLMGILLKFRERPYAIIGDIEKMFHQVNIREQDRDAQRCLW